MASVTVSQEEGRKRAFMEPHMCQTLGVTLLLIGDFLTPVTTPKGGSRITDEETEVLQSPVTLPTERQNQIPFLGDPSAN